jgi:hypothetical protein
MTRGSVFNSSPLVSHHRESAREILIRRRTWENPLFGDKETWKSRNDAGSVDRLMDRKN